MKNALAQPERAVWKLWLDNGQYIFCWAPDDFHPTLDALGKEYHYLVCTGKTQLPFHKHFSWHFPHSLDLDEMRHATHHLIGTRDFSPFSNEDVDNAVRTVRSIEIFEFEEELFCFKICGDNFLYKMVRNLVGTLCYVGCGRLLIDSVRNLQKRSDAGPTAPAHGLYLEHINYVDTKQTTTL